VKSLNLFLLIVIAGSFASVWALGGATGGGMSGAASGSTVLNQVEVGGNGDVKLSFSNNVPSDHVNTEFVDDSIQVSVDDATIYPPKIIPVSNSWIKKVFVYQFSANQVRCRITVQGKAETYKDRFLMNTEGMSVALHVDGGRNISNSEKSRSMGSSSSSSVRSGDSSSTDSEKNAPVGDELDEDQLLDKVIHSSPAASSSQSSQPSQTGQVQNSKLPLAGGKPLPAMGPVMVKIGLVLCLVLACLAGLKKFTSGKWNLGDKLGLVNGTRKKTAKLVDVLSSHYLGPKKTITLVRVAGRILVLGVTDSSISLITEIHDGKYDEKYSGLEDAKATDFSDLLSSEEIKPTPQQFTADPTNGGVRSMIRNRMEGLKQL